MRRFSVTRRRRAPATLSRRTIRPALLLAASLVAGVQAADTPGGHERHDPGATDSVVHPLVVLQADDERFVFSALGRDWEILLEARSPLSVRARAELADADLPTFLGGRVVGDPRSWVRLAREGRRHSGHLYTAGTLYRLEPPERLPGTRGYRLVQVGSGEALEAATLSRAVDPAVVVTRAMRVGIVIDSRFDEHHGGRGLARALTIMNGVDGLYRDQLGLAVEVERVRVLTEPALDPMRGETGTIEAVLTAFRDVRLGDPGLPTDLALVHLFSGHDTADDVIGLGWIDTVCRVDGYDVSMSTPFAFDTLLSAHEIAHNLGALHDEDPRCGAGTAADGLMEERLSSDTTTGFSACSLRRLQRTLAADCLVDSLDLVLEVDVSARRDDATWRIDVSVSNADPSRSARGVSTRTRLPSGGLVEQAGAGCDVVDELLVCEFGDIAPASTSTVTAVVRSRGGATDELVTVIDTGGFVDSDPSNDRVTVAFGARPGNAQALRAPREDDGTPDGMSGTAAGANGGGTGGDDANDTVTSGSVGVPLLLALLAGLGLRMSGRGGDAPPGTGPAAPID